MTFFEVGQAIERELGDRVKVPRLALPKLLSYIAGPLNGFSMKYVRRNVGHLLRTDNSRSKARLGIEYRDVAQTLVEHARQLLDQAN